MEISPISSRKSVPSSANSKRPNRRSEAPVKAPFSCPNSSDSKTDSAKAAQFKATIEALAERRNGVRFANLEGLIPGEYWGLKASTDGDGEPELDYMHFQFKGHQMLAEALKTEIEQR